MVIDKVNEVHIKKAVLMSVCRVFKCVSFNQADFLELD